MQLSRKTKRVMVNDDGLIPMINIVFLLLVFFMVAGAIKPAQPLDVEPPKSVQEGNQSAVHVVHVALDGSLALDGLVLSETQLVKALNRITTDSESPEPDRNASETGRPALALRADGQITFERLREVISMLRNAGVSNIELLTTWIPGATD